MKSTYWTRRLRWGGMLAGIALLAGSAVPGAGQPTSASASLPGLAQGGGTLDPVAGTVKEILPILGKIAPDLATIAAQHPNQIQHVLVAGTAVFRHPPYAAPIAALRLASSGPQTPCGRGDFGP